MANVLASAGKQSPYNLRRTLNILGVEAMMAAAVGA